MPPPGSVTVSPETARVVKKSKVGGTTSSHDDHTAQADANLPAHAPIQNQPTFTFTMPTQMRHDCPPSASAVGQLQQLTVFLNAALAAAKEMVTAHPADIPTNDWQSALNTANLVSATLSRGPVPPAPSTPPPSTPAPQDTSYAHAARMAQPPTQAPTPHTPRTRNRAHPQSSPKPHRHPFAAQRIILDYSGPTPKNFITNTKAFQSALLCDHLNDALDGPRIRAVSSSSNHRLVLFVAAPATAKQVLTSYRDELRKAFASFFHMTDWMFLDMELDNPWRAMVVHQVPGGGGFEPPMVVRQLLADNPGLCGTVPMSGARYLCSGDGLDRTRYVSMKFYVRDASLCQKLIREGLFMDSNHHRVSLYRPRTPTRHFEQMG